MRDLVLRLCSIILFLLLTTASQATAHPGHESQPDLLGWMHVLLSGEHLATFFLTGIAYGALMTFRRLPHVIAANTILIAFVSFQAWRHATAADPMFGAEIAMGGTLLAMLGWSAANRIGTWALTNTSDRSAPAQGVRRP